MTQKNQTDFITIVSGLPRSGTSLMMQMIHAGGVPAITDGIRVADSDNPRGYYEFEAVKKTRQDPSWLKSAPGKVVKMVHVLLLDLPTDPPAAEYRVVFMKRNLHEVMASQNKMLERLGKPIGDLPAERVMEVFTSQITKVEKWMRDHPCFKSLVVHYNELIKDPAPAVKALNEFLGGRLDTDAMLKAVDPSLYRQRK
jgi:hypothetical protein